MNLSYSLQKIRDILTFPNIYKYYILVKKRFFYSNNNNKCLKKNFIAMKLYAKSGKCH